MKKAYLILMLIVALGAFPPVCASEQEWSSANFNRHLSEQFEIVIEGGPCEDFHELRYQLSTDRKLSVESARQLLTDLAKAIGEEINTNPILKDRLPESPYPIERIDIALNSDLARANRTGEDVAYLWMHNGIVQYFRTERDNEARSLYEISAETWEDAVICADTGRESAPLCLGNWIFIDPADGSLDKGLESPEVSEALGDVIRQLMENPNFK